MDPTDTSNTTSVQFFNRQSYLNPCLDSSQRFVDKVIGEIAQMHKEAGQPIKTGTSAATKRKIFAWAPAIPTRRNRSRAKASSIRATKTSRGPSRRCARR
ncbi:hypothetical protein M8494_37415 [Serratia ureilytica]